MSINPNADAVQELALELLDAMHASSLDAADQANALAHALLLWSSNLSFEHRDRFLRHFVELLRLLRPTVETTLRRENVLQ